MSAPKKKPSETSQPKLASADKKASQGGAPAEEVNEPEAEGYKVGPGCPPLEHQFKKGNTKGKGRKKGSKNFKTVFNEAFGMKVKGKLGGKPKSMSKMEAGMHHLATKHSQGDPKATDKAIPLYERYGPQEDPEGPPPQKLAKDFRALEKYLAMKDQIFPKDLGGDHDQA